LAVIETRRKKEEGRRKKEEGRTKIANFQHTICDGSFPTSSQLLFFLLYYTRLL
jgi:hypothetical protein